MKQLIKSQKGFTLTELLLALLIISMTSVLLTQMLSYTLSSTNAFSQYGNQQFTINHASIRLGKDIERAVLVNVADVIVGNEYRTIEISFEDGCSCSWRIGTSGGLYHKPNSNDEVLVISDIAPGSKFIYSNDCLTVVLVPEASKTVKYKINVSKPVVSQYNIKYKKGY
ncbi:MAG: prepilin-type N-terminal cleavage/methylation domain-containing protein [Clostridiaceae bacterium]|nr:prepilin-type N-terminal cleavage/methylation domain-containing protein [Clostridiaceae bacterium]